MRRPDRPGDIPPKRPGASGSCWLVLICLAWFGGLPLLGARAAENVVIPNFWDPRARADKPDLGSLRVIRFLTDDEYPPLHFADAEGNPTGFSVELAKAACETLSVACTIQVRRFDTLLESLAERRGDAIAAAIPITAQLRERFSMTRPYHRMPARFAIKKDATLPEPTADNLAGRGVGVVAGSAHEAYLATFFEKADRKAYPDLSAARAALRRGEIDYLFADGMTLAIWIGGTDAAGCCAFVGGPYLSMRHFGEGVGFIVRREDDLLRRALDYALQKLWDDGVYSELYLRHFPVSFY